MGAKQTPQPSPLTEAQIRQEASAESFARGAEYFRRGAVGTLILRGDQLHAEVEGSEYEPYRVTVSFDPAGVRAASCTCPYDWGGWCKHIVATLLAFAAQPSDVERRPPLAELLAGLDREQLAAVLLRLAEDEPALVDAIEDQLVPKGARGAALAQLPPVAADAPAGASAVKSGGGAPTRRTAVDVDGFKRQLRRVFRSQGTDDYLAYEGILADLEPLVAQIRGFLDGDDARSALPLLEALTDEYSDAWVEFDDSDGELGGFFEELGELWAEALLASNLKQAERKTWRERLEEWAGEAEEYGCEGLEIAVQAASEGWTGSWLDGAMQGDVRPGTQPDTPYAAELTQVRLRILERSGYITEALRLAAAAGMYREQALILVRQGRGAEAAALGQRQISTPEDALVLAQTLREQGDPAGALAVAEHGFGLGASEAGAPGQEFARARLAAWLVELAAGQGRAELALRAGTEALRVEPQLSLYRRLAELAGAHLELVEGGWPALRERLLAALRASTAWRASGRIEIFLAEGLIDDAIAALGKHPDSSSLVRVMDAAITARPDWVISAATGNAERIMDAGDAKHYDSAIGWLRRARSGYEAAGRVQDWTAYVQQLRAKHIRKYKLVALLDGLERPRR